MNRPVGVGHFAWPIPIGAVKTALAGRLSVIVRVRSEMSSRVVQELVAAEGCAAYPACGAVREHRQADLDPEIARAVCSSKRRHDRGRALGSRRGYAADDCRVRRRGRACCVGEMTGAHAESLFPPDPERCRFPVGLRFRGLGLLELVGVDGIARESDRARCGADVGASRIGGRDRREGERGEAGDEQGSEALLVACCVAGSSGERRRASARCRRRVPG